MHKWTLALAATALAGLAGCAQQPAADPAPVPSPTASARMSMVPNLTSDNPVVVEKEILDGELVPIMKYEPGVVADANTVVNTVPAPGTRVPAGTVVTIVVAGSPAAKLSAVVDADRETFVGLAKDRDGSWVVAVSATADLPKTLQRLKAVAGSAPYRVQTCERSWVELTRVQIELGRRDFLPGADKLAFSTGIDPIACAVLMTVQLSDGEIAELTARYRGALVVRRGDVRRD
ncbi:PASTA domain-containing protein [Catellatospora tritici]|uniref:PASTA domain-containing protein n=1 Tax=Catellatospora tritici TaxID=2851566 RepID=UPI001C2D580D|nr:PASTA domain-containing protein [Catellatospora tritici]MBV1852482.1 PASTA domain-containing protein [Catellatospora tritici]